ncbi:hypothetical protein [Providencia rettgeri]|uniref:hypothetical protein n=1 Tax=Providencia rettgeri TaxID=587 RepID=UPI0018C72249|nr:hypothetical protein [Providencia rettgeri]MBG5900135.1 hypothetical protein [Providencia rettgeri]
MDKSRQQFESMAIKQFEEWAEGKDLYNISPFDIWEASRESLEVELPEPFIANETWCYDEDLVNQALISNGVKIKNE